MGLYNSYLFLLLWDPSSLSNIPHLKLKDWTKPGDVTGKWAKNRRWGLSTLDFLHQASMVDLKMAGLGGGGGSLAGAWGGYMLFHKSIADRRKLFLWISAFHSSLQKWKVPQVCHWKSCWGGEWGLLLQLLGCFLGGVEWAFFSC